MGYFSTSDGCFYVNQPNLDPVYNNVMSYSNLSFHMTGPTGYTYVNGDVPLVSDPFGEGLNRCMIYRPSNGTWFIKNIGCWNAPTSNVTGSVGTVTWNSVIYVKVTTVTSTTSGVTTVVTPSAGCCYANPDGVRTTIPTTSNTSTTSGSTTTTTNISVTHYTSSDVYVASFSGGGDADSVPFVGDIFGKSFVRSFLGCFLVYSTLNNTTKRLCRCCSLLTLFFLWTLILISYIPGDGNRLIVWRPSTGNWYCKSHYDVRCLSTPATFTSSPVAMTNVAAWAAAAFNTTMSPTQFNPAGSMDVSFQCGGAGDIPLIGNIFGDGRYSFTTQHTASCQQSSHTTCSTWYLPYICHTSEFIYLK